MLPNGADDSCKAYDLEIELKVWDEILIWSSVF